MNFEDGSFAEESLREILPGQFPGGQHFFIPVPGLPGDVFLVAKLAGESIFSADGVDSVVELWADPGIHLLELNHVNIQKNVSSITGLDLVRGRYAFVIH